MDSVSQAALGAAVGHAVAGGDGRKAAAWGAALATLPDLDVFVPLGNDVLEFTAHRAASHSLFVMAAVAPVLVWALGRLHPQVRRRQGRWAVLVLGCFWTHALLDAFTAYGTQLWWPFGDQPVFWSTIFIIDPLFTLPLLVGVVAALLRPGAGTRRWNAAGLAVSGLYLVWTVAAQAHVEARAHQDLAAVGVRADRLMSTPTPFNSLLWRVLATAGDDHWEGYHSLVDGADDPIRFRRSPRGGELLAPIADTWAVQRLRWFTGGYHATRVDGDRVVLADLRMGMDPFYVFQFAVGHRQQGTVVPVPAVQVSGPEAPAQQLSWVWRRIWDAGATFEPRASDDDGSPAGSGAPGAPAPPQR